MSHVAMARPPHQPVDTFVGDVEPIIMFVGSMSPMNVSYICW
jgi:hypothetical protein